jgi:hypothetical protein
MDNAQTKENARAILDPTIIMITVTIIAIITNV